MLREAAPAPGATRRRSGSRRRPPRTSARSRSAGSACAGSRRSSATTSSTSSTSTRRDQLPESLTGYIRDREGYDYRHHAEVGSSNARFVSDEVIDRSASSDRPRSTCGGSRAPRRRCRPVQPLPHERRRGGAAGGLRPRDHPCRACRAGQRGAGPRRPATSWPERPTEHVEGARPVFAAPVAPSARMSRTRPGPLRGARVDSRGTPELAARGVTCPACGLANEAGARVCRNCGLPIASTEDPLRGVRANRVEIVGASRSRVSATLGLALVIGLLLIGGTLAVSGGGILNSGGRLGADPGASPGAGTGTGDPASSPGAVAPAIPDGQKEPDDREGGAGKADTSFDFTCEAGAIRDLSKGRWQLSQFRVGERLADDGNYDRITWEMTRRGRKSGAGTLVTMAWMTPEEAVVTTAPAWPADARHRPHLRRAGVGHVGQKVDAPLARAGGRRADPDRGDVDERGWQGPRGHRAAGDSCARMSALNWSRSRPARRTPASP